jgi:hypothetical protein
MIQVKQGYKRRGTAPSQRGGLRVKPTFGLASRYARCSDKAVPNVVSCRRGFAIRATRDGNGRTARLFEKWFISEQSGNHFID